MRALVSFVAGGIFAMGLAVSGMTSPAKVAGFLDFLGAWDPSLALVMVGAIGTYLPLQWIARRRAAPILGERFAIPPEQKIDARLIGGAALFGMGWGAIGYCPGPAIASLGTGAIEPVLFVLAMAAGMGIFELSRARTTERASA